MLNVEYIWTKARGYKRTLDLVAAASLLLPLKFIF